jgi:4TM region of DNA translocase FtsK/SpoIIIE
LKKAKFIKKSYLCQIEECKTNIISRKQLIMARRRGFSLGLDFSDERVPKLFGAILLFLSAYFTIAFTSYLFTWAEDQDSVLRFSWSLLFMGEMEMANWLGRLGAIISNLFFYWTFGLPCIVFIYLAYIYCVGHCVMPWFLWCFHRFCFISLPSFLIQAFLLVAFLDKVSAIGQPIL